MNSEEIFREALEDRQEGVRVGDGTITNMRSANDTAILADNRENLQTLVNLVNEASRWRGLQIKSQKQSEWQSEK